MVLTSRQRTALHGAILAYLEHTKNEETGEPMFRDAVEAFRREAGVEVAADDASSGKRGSSAPLLEKKWTAVVRLQRKVMSLESEIERLRADVRLKGKGGASASSSANGTSGDYMPPHAATHALSGHRAPITAVAFHPVYNLMVSASEDASVKIFDYESGEYERTLKGHTNAVLDCAFSADGALLATCSSDLAIKLWDFKTFACVKTLHGHDHTISGLAFCEAKNTLLVSCSRDKTLKVWDTETGFCVRTMTGHVDWVRKVAVFGGSCSDVAASCSIDHTLMTWNVSTGQCMSTFRGHEHVVEHVAFSTASADKVLRRVGQPGSGTNPNGGVAGMAFTGKRLGGEHLISGSRDRTIRIWRAVSGICLMVLSGHDNWVRGVACQPNGKYIVSVAEDKTIKAWDVEQERAVRTVQDAHSHFVTCVALHPSWAFSPREAWIGLSRCGSPNSPSLFLFDIDKYLFICIRVFVKL